MSVIGRGRLRTEGTAKQSSLLFILNFMSLVVQGPGFFSSSSWPVHLFINREQPAQDTQSKHYCPR